MKLLSSPFAKLILRAAAQRPSKESIGGYLGSETVKHGRWRVCAAHGMPGRGPGRILRENKPTKPVRANLV